jgi:hypothetical protein
VKISFDIVTVALGPDETASDDEADGGQQILLIYFILIFYSTSPFPMSR